MWIELKDPAGLRLLVNLDLTFAVQEEVGGTAKAVSLNGIGVPTGETYGTVRDNIHNAE